MTDPDIDVDANEDPVEVAAFVPTQVKQFSRSVAAFTEFWSRPHLSAWIIHRFYDDGVPFDNQNEDPNAGKDGQEEGNFGVWPTWDGSVPKAASPTRKLYCKLNRLEGNPDAPYAALTEPYQNPAVTAPQAQLPDEAVCSE